MVGNSAWNAYTKEHLEQQFPNLAHEGYTITSPDTIEYVSRAAQILCFAQAACLLCSAEAGIVFSVAGIRDIVGLGR
ncbi:MAG: hypothetical protein WBB01_13730 [Phormidesmis sp.]